MPEINKAVITDLELMELNNSPVPSMITLRLLLSQKGIKFEDDGSLALVINQHPKPLGELSIEYDLISCETKYKQVIK